MRKTVEEVDPNKLLQCLAKDGPSTIPGGPLEIGGLRGNDYGPYHSELPALIDADDPIGEDTVGRWDRSELPGSI